MAWRFFALFLLIGWLSPVLLLSPSSAQAGQPEAMQFAKQVGDRVLSTLAAGTTDAEKQRALKALFEEVVDTDWVGRFVLGRYWRTLNDGQRREYLASYREFLVNNYTANFKDYTEGTEIEVLRGTPLQREGEHLISVKVKRPNQTVAVDYRVRQNAASAFRVIDIVVEGVSLLATQRSEFSSVIQRKGVEHLIEQLKKRAAAPVPVLKAAPAA